MTVKIYFESLTSGMKAKLDTRYKANNNYTYNFRKTYGYGYGANLLGDTLEKSRLKLIGKNR